MTTRANGLSRSLAAFDEHSSLVVVVEMGLKSWLVGGLIPGVERHPKKKMEPDPEMLLGLIGRWRGEAAKAGRPTTRVALAYEAGRDGFWLARWLESRGIEAHVIHSTSVAVSREKRRAKTDRVDAEMLLRVFLGWLRGERDHCSMVAVPTIEVEDDRRPGRERDALVAERTRIVNRMKADMARLGVRAFKPFLRSAPKKLSAVQTPEGMAIPPNTKAELERDMTRLAVLNEQIAAIEKTRLERIKAAPGKRTHAMILLARSLLWHRHRDSGPAGERGDDPKSARSPRRGALRRDHRVARRERRATAREGARKNRQRPRPSRHDPARVALAAVSEGERSDALVQGARRRRSRPA